MPLLPGDIIMTGTPSGLVGAGITTVRLPVQDVAQTASRVLLNVLNSERTNGGHAKERATIRLNPSLILTGIDRRHHRRTGRSDGQGR
jgi:2-keto-4-pentenoate hydratase/2-oxohepta-3-ene-1,7-dioic acid hydratase in catechol pathway